MLEFDRSHLIAALQVAQFVADRRSTMPVIGGALVVPDGDEAIVAATDLNVTAIVRLPAKKFDDGCRVVVPPRRILGVLSVDPGPRVILGSAGAHGVKLTGGSCEYELVTVAPVDSFPKFDRGEGMKWTRVPAPVLFRLIQRVHFAISTDETRYHLCGALLSLKDGAMQLVATDGHRLAIGRESVDAEAKIERTFIRRKGILAWRRLLDGVEGDVEIGVSKTIAAIRAGAAMVLVKLDEGVVFPPYEKIIPDRAIVTTTVDRERLLGALRRVAAMFDKGEVVCGVKLVVSRDTIIVGLDEVATERGKATERVPAIADGEITIGFNIRYLLDALGSMSAAKVVLGIGGPLDAVTVRGGGDESTIHVVMPMRV